MSLYSSLFLISIYLWRVNKVTCEPREFRGWCRSPFPSLPRLSFLSLRFIHFILVHRRWGEGRRKEPEPTEDVARMGPGSRGEGWAPEGPWREWRKEWRPVASDAHSLYVHPRAAGRTGSGPGPPGRPFGSRPGPCGAKRVEKGNRARVTSEETRLSALRPAVPAAGGG